MFGYHAPNKFCFALCQCIDRDERGGLFAIADTQLRFSIALEYVNMWRLVIVRPNDELEAVDEKNCWHGLIIPVRLGYSSVRMGRLWCGDEGKDFASRCHAACRSGCLSFRFRRIALGFARHGLRVADDGAVDFDAVAVIKDGV